MRLILSLFVFCICVLPATGIAGQVQFFSTISDLPLMPGLSERAEDTLIFDKAGGRVIESYADILGGVDQGAVEAYYASSLPQFGWQAISNARYMRADEVLEYRVENSGDEKIFTVRISPK